MNNFEMKIVNEEKMFAGAQRIYTHNSQACNCEMRVSIFLPPQYFTSPHIPVLVYLSGLTCTEENFTVKAGAQRIAAQLGVVIIAPDTSPRGDNVPDNDSYDMAKGAGFYLNATQEPWQRHYQMESYVRDEITALAQALGVDTKRMGIFGHSMGGHGALSLHLKNPEVFKTCSAFAPICTPMQIPWGQKAFTAYLGDEQTTWQNYDSTHLVSQKSSRAHILIDQGMSDEFLTQLRPDIFEKACQHAGQKLTLRRQKGYGHSYYFIASFMEDHLRHHMQYL